MYEYKVVYSNIHTGGTQAGIYPPHIENGYTGPQWEYLESFAAPVPVGFEKPEMSFRLFTVFRRAGV